MRPTEDAGRDHYSAREKGTKMKVLILRFLLSVGEGNAKG